MGERAAETALGIILRRLHVGLSHLHDDAFGGVGGADELEIFDRGQLHAAPEVEAPAAQVLVPVGGLVAQLHPLHQI